MSALFYKGKKREMELSSGQSDNFHGYADQIRGEITKRISMLGNLDEIRVLDIGTGHGITVSFLTEVLPSDKTRIWTVDPSSDILENAKKILKEKSTISNVEFVQAAAERLDRFEDNYFDLVISVMVLHHVISLEPVLEEMTRVVKKQGKIVLVDWKPEARRLPFRNAHEEKDFFNTTDIQKETNKLAVESKCHDFEYWYLVELCKNEIALKERSSETL